LGSGVEVTQLKAQDLTSVQSRYTHYYKAGDVALPKREYKRSGLHKLQPYVVEEVKRDRLHLRDLSGNSLSVDPIKFRLSVYTKETVEIAVGDRLRWTLNSPDFGRRNGQEFVVTGIEGSEATIEYKDGSRSRINLYQPLHLDYALVSTTYSSQGKTAERVLISAAADPTVSAQSFYVAISRARSGLQIYAEDKELLLELAQSRKAKENPLELRRQQVGERVAAEPVLRASPIVEQKEFDATPTQEQVLPAIFDYGKQQAVQTALTSQALLTLTESLNHLPEATKTEQNQEDLTNKLSQLQVQSASRAIQQLAPELLSDLVPAQTTVIGSETLKRNTDQLLQALADYIEVAAIEAALTQPLTTLNEELRSWQAQGINKGHSNDQSQSGIAKFIELDPVELEISPVLDHLISNSSTLQTGKSLPLVSDCPNEDIFAQSVSSIANYIELAAIESEITEAVVDLTKQLTLHKSEFPTSNSQLDSAISNFLAQETSKLVVAMSNYIKHSPIDSTLDSQSLSEQVNQQYTLGDPELNAAMQQLSAIVAGIQAPGQDLALGKAAGLQAEAIADSGKQTAINEAIAQLPEIVARPSERTNEKHDRGEISAQPASVPPQERENELPTDMAALLRAANRKLPSPPDWLVVGNWVHCTDTGWGEVTAILGARLVVKLDSGELAQIPDWPAAVESKLVSATADAVQKPRVLELSSKSELSLDAKKAGDKLAQLGIDENHPRQQERLAVEQFTDSELLLAQKAVADYFAASPEKPPSLNEQLVVKLEIDRLDRQIDRLWQKQALQVKIAEEMQKNPFSAWSKKYTAQLKQLETTMEAISQSLAQKDQKETQLQQWSKQSQADQEWSDNPQTIAMRQLATDLNQPQVQCRLQALKLELNRQSEQLDQSPDYQLQQHLQSLNPQQLWSHYSFGPSPQHTHVEEMATRLALRDKLPHSFILKMLTHSRQYKSCERQYGSQNAQRLADLILNASIRKEQQQALMIAQTVSLLLNQMKLGERQTDGSLTFKSQSFEYHQHQRTISLIARDGHKEILRVTDGKVVVDSMTKQDVEKCLKLRREIEKDLQKLAQPEPEKKQSRGLSR
jgi:hypothetical protein